MVETSYKEYQAHERKFALEAPKHWGEAPKEVDPNKLLDGATHMVYSYKGKHDLVIIVDSKHPDADFNSCKAITNIWELGKGTPEQNELYTKYTYDRSNKQYIVYKGHIINDELNNNSKAFEVTNINE